jgi:hypothetical protein
MGGVGAKSCDRDDNMENDIKIAVNRDLINIIMVNG